jgi:phosphoglycolate phosphatase-like HAD superfamily hydrolase
MTLQQKFPGIYLDDSLTIDSIDAIIFDCDGVLIDITKSYDSTITKTVQYILKNFTDVSDGITIDHKIIDGFKSTGGFNDEVDLAYAAILCIVAAKKLQKDQIEFIFEVIKNADTSGIVSVEKYLNNTVDISQIKNLLEYPGTHHNNPLYRIFDELFYGPELYLKLFGMKSRFSESGLIQYDDVIVNFDLLEKLEKKFSRKIGMVTGRGYESVKYSLQDMMEKFDLKNSLFLEDESRSLAKPNPESLIRCISGMNGTTTLYVGDSMEDFIMAKKVTETGRKVVFCGIIGSSKAPDEKLTLFEQNGVILAIDSIKHLPKILNLE